MTDAQIVQDAKGLFDDLYRDERVLIERALDRRSVQQPRDFLIPIPDDAPAGPYTDADFAIWDAPHLPRGLFLRAATAATAVVTIEASYDGGVTWVDTMLAGEAGAATHATMSGARYGGAHKSFLDTPPITGAGQFSVPRFDPGTVLRVNLVSRGGATKLKVQLVCHVARPLIVQAAPLTGRVSGGA